MALPTSKSPVVVKARRLIFSVSGNFKEKWTKPSFFSREDRMSGFYETTRRGLPLRNIEKKAHKLCLGRWKMSGHATNIWWEALEIDVSKHPSGIIYMGKMWASHKTNNQVPKHALSHNTNIGTRPNVGLSEVHPLDGWVTPNRNYSSLETHWITISSILTWNDFVMVGSFW